LGLADAEKAEIMSHEDQERLNLEAKLRKDKLEAKIEYLQTRHAAREVASATKLF
jgi:hypothetical protein